VPDPFAYGLYVAIAAALAGDAPAAFTPASIPPVVDRNDWALSALEPPGRLAVPGTVQGLLWTAGLAGRPGPATAGAGAGMPARGANYVFSFDGQLEEPVAFIVPDGQPTFVGKGKGARGGDIEMLKALRPGVANDWKLSAAAHIVELEVRRGRGREALPPASTSSLVVSKVRVVDERTFTGPIASVIAWAARDFDGVVREKGQAALFDGVYRLDVRPTWFRNRKQLVIRFVLRAMGREAHPLQCAPCIAGRACACAFTGVALGGEYAFDARARLISRAYFLPRPQDLTVLGGEIL